MPRIIAVVLVLLAASVPTPAPVAESATRSPQFRAWVMARLPESPEGLAQDAKGRIYAVIAKPGEVVRLDEKGGYEHYATVPSQELHDAGYSIGADFDRDGNLYVAYTWLGSRSEVENDPMHLACRDSTDRFTGVYRVDAVTHEVTPFVTKADGWPTCFPDDVAVDSHGNVYVTDLTLSGIWKLTPDRKFSLWSAGPLLQWPAQPYTDVPEGVNDLTLDKEERNVYAATDGFPGVVRIPINSDGSAGAAAMVARDLAPLDGIEFDDDGNLYVTETVYNRIVMLSPDFKIRRTIASAENAPLGNPTSLVYRRGMLCTTNFGFATNPPPRSVVCLSGFKPGGR